MSTEVEGFSPKHSDIKKSIGFDQILEDTITYQKHHNCTYTSSDVLNNMINAVVLGYTRFSHIDTLRNDKAYNKIMGGKVASEKVCHDFLLKSPSQTKCTATLLN